jgi:hypothetical protein
MKISPTAVVLLMLSGCGNASDDPLQGTWFMDSDAKLQVRFDGNTWAMDTMHTLNGIMAVEVDSGTYSVSGSTITLTATASSCQGLQSVTKTATATFSCGGGYLTLNLNGSALHFRFGKWILSDTEIGCFDSQNSFTANPIGPVP